MRCVCLWCVDARCAGVALAALASALRSAFHPVFIFHVGSGMCHRDGAARLRRAASEMILVCKSSDGHATGHQPSCVQRVCGAPMPETQTRTDMRLLSRESIGLDS